MASDPFSDFLGLTRAHSNHTGGFVAGGAWAVAVPKPEALKFWAVVRGTCWLILDGKKPQRMNEGDVFLLAHPKKHVLASSPDVKPMRLEDALKDRSGPIVRIGKGEEVFMLGNKVVLDSAGVTMLLETLPPLVHIKASSPIAQTLRWLMEQLARERVDASLGTDVVSAQLAHLMFIQILRAHFEGGARRAAGWLRAVSDKKLAPVLRRIHDDPGREWTLEELAHHAAMSRATFAAYFKSVAGVAPIAYVTDWRMRLAAKALREDGASVGELSRRLGYASESAFSHAFKRVTGESPRACKYRVSASAAR